VIKMAFSLDTRLIEGELIQERINDFGVHKKCLRCPVFNKCNAPQYNAPGCTFFFCADYLKGRKT